MVWSSLSTYGKMPTLKAKSTALHRSNDGLEQLEHVREDAHTQGQIHSPAQIKRGKQTCFHTHAACESS